MPDPGNPRLYTAADVPWRLRDQLQLRAVLVPLTGRYRAQGEVPPRVHTIQKRWRCAAQRLGRLGWAPVAEAGRLLSARRCPPTFLLARGRRRPCHLRTACPFCWARQAAEWWDRVDDAFFRDTAAAAPRDGRAGRAIELADVPAVRPRRARAAGYTLVARGRTYTLPPYIATATSSRLDMLREFYAARLGRGSHFRDLGWFVRGGEVAAGLRAIARPGRRRGCFEHITAEADRGGEAWKVTIRQVWLVPAGAELPAIMPQEGVTYAERACADPWRNQVMKAMARACRYPRVMLSSWRGGAPAYQLVTARQGLRLAANYGDFRRGGGST